MDVVQKGLESFFWEVVYRCWTVGVGMYGALRFEVSPINFQLFYELVIFEYFYHS